MQDITDVVVYIKDNTIHYISSPFYLFTYFVSITVPSSSTSLSPPAHKDFVNITDLKTRLLLICRQLQLPLHFSAILSNLSSILF